MQLAVQHRDKEIERLSERVATGTENDFASLTMRNETNESIILSLNQQVCFAVQPAPCACVLHLLLFALVL